MMQLLNMRIFHGYVTNNQRVNIYSCDCHHLQRPPVDPGSRIIVSSVNLGGFPTSADVQQISLSYPLVICYIAIENHHFNRYIIYKWFIFHSFVTNNQRVSLVRVATFTNKYFNQYYSITLLLGTTLLHYIIHKKYFNQYVNHPMFRRRLLNPGRVAMDFQAVSMHSLGEGHWKRFCVRP